jgi:hypothetical protein
MMDTARVKATPTLFATPIQTPETMATQVRHQLERRFADDLPPGVDLASIALQAVENFNSARVKAFVPVLAVREAREILVRLSITRADG